MLEIIWENEPLRSGTLANICLSEYGWKKSTVYTILKNVCEGGFAENDRGTVKAIISEKDYFHNIAKGFVDSHFGSSLPDFLAAFLDGKHMTRDEILECYEKVKKYREQQ